MSKILTRGEILSLDDSPLTRIPVKEWGGDVFARALSADEREEFETFASGKPKSGIQAHLLAICLVDESGNRLFNDDDVIALGKKNGAPVGRIFKSIMKLNAMTDDEMKELEKN